MAYSPEYEKRWAELRRLPKQDLLFECGWHGVLGPNLQNWSHHDLEKAILRSEFPQEASNG